VETGGRLDDLNEALAFLQTNVKREPSAIADLKARLELLSKHRVMSYEDGSLSIKIDWNTQKKLSPEEIEAKAIGSLL
jgi:hypothetical protein